MSEVQIEKTINNAAASIEMEGFSIDEQSKMLCRKLLLNEITMEQYIALVKQRAGVNV
ncbi:MAG: antitoxin VbhA family protein [Clostridium sp.]|nr:antitoxin VbhA family protein [Clostridium sp.]